MSISWAVGVVHEDISFASLAAYGAVCVTALVEWACFVLYGIEWALLMAAPANHTYALQTEQCVHCNSLQLTFRSQWVSRRSRSLFARHPSEDPPYICSSLEHGRNCQTTKLSSTVVHRAQCRESPEKCGVHVTRLPAQSLLSARPFLVAARIRVYLVNLPSDRIMYEARRSFDLPFCRDLGSQNDDGLATARYR